MKFFIGIVPPEDIYSAVVNIQNKFGDNRLEPHITLRPPVTVTQQDQWITAIEKVCATLSPVKINLPGTGHFGNRVLFIEVVSEELTGLHNAVVKAIKPFEQIDAKSNGNENYRPHLTLARKWCGFTKHDFVDMKVLADEFLSGQQVCFTANSVRIYHKPLPGGRYEPLKDVSLNTGLK